MQELGFSISAFVLAFGLLVSTVHAQVPKQTPSGAAQPEAKTPILSKAQFEALLKEPKKLLILDVRRPDEVSKIGGFPVYISAQLGDLEQNLAWIPKDRQIVVISNHAARAGRAGDLLTARGYKVAGRLGVQTYEEEGGKVLHIDIPPPRTATAAQNAPTAGEKAR